MRALLTLQVNVPMNEALAQVALPLADEEATRIWAGYAPDWQIRNRIRTVASGVALLLVGLRLMALPHRSV